MSSDTNPDDATAGDRDTTERGTTAAPSGLGRRPLLKALGVGAGISLGGGTAAAQTEPDPPLIDPRFGYTTSAADDVPQRLDPDHEVELHIEAPVPEERPPLFHFEPTGLSLDPGDIVQFTATTPDHTVTAYHPAHGSQRRIPETAAPFSSPVIPFGGAWLYRFTEPGLYDLYCAPHHILGMAGRLVVGDLEDVPDYEDTFEAEPPLLPPFDQAFLEEELTAFSEADENQNPEWVWLTPREVLAADVLDPSNIVDDDGQVQFETVLDTIDRFA